MKSLDIVTVLVAVIGQILVTLVARDSSETWGYLQWSLLPVVYAAFTLAGAHCWGRLVRG